MASYIRNEPILPKVAADLRRYLGQPANWRDALAPALSGWLAVGLLLRPTALLSFRGVGLGFCGAAAGIALWGSFAILCSFFFRSDCATSLRRDAPTFWLSLLAATLATLGRWLHTDAEFLRGFLLCWAQWGLAAFLASKLWVLPIDPFRRVDAVLAQRGGLVVGLMVGAATVALTSAAVWRHAHFLTATHDFGLMVQTIWNTAHGRLLTYSVDHLEPVCRVFKGRMEAVYLPLAALYRLWSDPRLLLAVQALFLSLGAMVVHRLSLRTGTGGLLAVALAAGYLLHPAVIGVDVSAFHATSLAVPLLLLVFCCAAADNARGVIIAGLAALLCREDLALVLVVLGVWIAHRPNMRRPGWVLSLISGLWFLFFTFIVPRLAGHDGAVTTVRESKEFMGLLAQGPAGMVRELARHPSLMLTNLFTSKNALYLSQLIVGLGGLALLRLEVLATAVLPLLLFTLSGWHEMTQLDSHYPAFVVASLAAASVFAAARLVAVPDAGESEAITPASSRRRNALVALVMLSAILSHRSYAPSVRCGVPWTADHLAAMQATVDAIPPRASVAASQHLGPHLAHRQRLHIWGSGADADWQVFDSLQDLHFDRRRPASRTSVEAEWRSVLPPSLMRRDDYGLVAERDGVLVWRKGADHTAGLRLAYVSAQGPPSGLVEGMKAGALTLVGVTATPSTLAEGVLVDWRLWWRVDSAVRSWPQFKLTAVVDQREWSVVRTVTDNVLPLSAVQPGEYVLDAIRLRVYDIGTTDEIHLRLEIDETGTDRLVKTVGPLK